MKWHCQWYVQLWRHNNSKFCQHDVENSASICIQHSAARSSRVTTLPRQLSLPNSQLLALPFQPFSTTRLRPRDRTRPKFYLLLDRIGQSSFCAEKSVAFASASLNTAARADESSRTQR